MSFDVFVTAYHRGAVTIIPKSVVEAVLGPLSYHPVSGVCRMRFHSMSELYMGSENKVSGFMITWPPLAMPEFCEAILKLLQQTSTLLYWPGGGCIVGNEAALRDVPDDMVEGLGKPILVVDAAQIPEIIDKSQDELYGGGQAP